MFELAEINASNWQRALQVEVRSDQVRFVAGHQPVALVILSKCTCVPTVERGRLTLPSATTSL